MADRTRHTWNAAYQEALEFDTWGQVEEAVASYHRLQVAAALESRENKLGLQGTRKAAVAELAAALKLRIQELNASTPGRVPGLGLTGMQTLKPFVSGLLVSDVQLPPAVALALKSAAADTACSAQVTDSLQQLRLRPQGTQQQQQQQGAEDLITTAMEPQDSGELGAAERRQQHGAGVVQSSQAPGTLRPAPTDLQPGDITLSLTFGSWSAKGADSMQPHVVITVRDKRGKLLEAVQESPQVCASRSGAADKLDLDFDWHLQTPLNCLPEDAAVFMELQHWKADKKKMSVRCYALLPYDELLRPGAAMLQLWKKPVEHKQRGQRPSYTSKPMYVHVMRSMVKH